MNYAFEVVEELVNELALKLVLMWEDYSYYAPEVADLKLKLEHYLEIRNQLAELENVKRIDVDTATERAAETYAGA